MQIRRLDEAKKRTRELAIEGLRERKSAQARAATLDAGFRLFGERGYDQVTVAEICAAADIGRRTFFHYFPSKEDLLSSPIREMAARLTAVLDQVPAGATDGRAVREALTDLARYTLAHRARLALYRRIITTSASARLPVWNLPEHELRVAQLLWARHGASGPPDLATRLLVARGVAGFRVWLDLVIDSETPGDGPGSKVGQLEPGAPGGDAAALRLLARIFDADPLLAAPS
ncbi:MAG: TetR family transcriptional regulator [Trebonia sp.]